MIQLHRRQSDQKLSQQVAWLSQCWRMIAPLSRVTPFLLPVFKTLMNRSIPWIDEQSQNCWKLSASIASYWVLKQLKDSQNKLALSGFEGQIEVLELLATDTPTNDALHINHQRQQLTWWWAICFRIAGSCNLIYLPNFYLSLLGITNYGKISNFRWHNDTISYRTAYTRIPAMQINSISFFYFFKNRFSISRQMCGGWISVPLIDWNFYF